MRSISFGLAECVCFLTLSPVTRAERESGLEKSLHFLFFFFLRWESLKSGAALLTKHSRQPGKGRICVVSKIICKVQYVNLHFFFSLCFFIFLTYMLHLFVGFIVNRLLCILVGRKWMYVLCWFKCKSKIWVAAPYIHFQLIHYFCLFLWASGAAWFNHSCYETTVRIIDAGTHAGWSPGIKKNLWLLTSKAVKLLIMAPVVTTNGWMRGGSTVVIIDRICQGLKCRE